MALQQAAVLVSHPRQEVGAAARDQQVDQPGRLVGDPLREQLHDQVPTLDERDGRVLDHAGDVLLREDRRRCLQIVAPLVELTIALRDLERSLRVPPGGRDRTRHQLAEPR